jgi:hypothetical protein
MSDMLPVFPIIVLIAVISAGISEQTAGLSWAKAAVPLQRPTERVIFIQAEGSHVTETILRQIIQDLQEGKPDFEKMEPELANAVKAQSKHTADIYRHLGALRTLKYLGTRDGADIYRAVYEHAAVSYTIRLSPSGKISILSLQPAFPWE